jgi:hypothetical protein
MDFEMADTTDVSDSNSYNLMCNINGVAASNCSNCIALKNNIHNLILQLESADLIIKLLQERGNKYN